VVLADGATMAVRPIVPADAEGINSLHKRLSAETIYFRFFTPMPTLSAKMLDHLVNVDYVERMALVGILGDEIIGVARYERLPTAGPDGGTQAEVAFLVDDAHQGRGIGSILLEHLAAAAEDAGVGRFVADTLPDNQRMLRVFHDAGFGDEHAFDDGVVRVAFPIKTTAESLETRHFREQRAAARSVHRLLAPATVAVIGPGRRETSLGHNLLRRLLDSGFAGPVYPVHREAHHVASVRAWPSVVEVPDRVDLAVIVVPTDSVAEVVAQCARKRVGGLVIVSTGFAEQGEEGLAAERGLVAEARRYGMRIIGPGSMGVINTDPEVKLNATFSPAPPRGPVGFVAQSGGLGVVILDELVRRGLGVSTFVSAGNKADVSGNDLLHYWDSDPSTAVIGMYIEAFGNPRVFARVARRVSRRKPIVAVKSGRSGAGLRVAGRHGPEQADVAVDALFRQTGVIRTDTLEELFDAVSLLASQPLPRGNRVAIVANAGGPSVLAADASAGAGLVLAELSEETVGGLAGVPVEASSHPNPVALTPDAPPEDFGRAVQAVLADPAVDACIAISTMPLPSVGAAVARTLVEASAAHPDTPLLACVLGRRGLLGEEPGGGVRAPADGSGLLGEWAPPAVTAPSASGGRRVPAYAFPEAAARALGRVAAYAAWRRRPEGRVVHLEGVDRQGARRTVEAALAAGDGGPVELDPASAAALLACYGVGPVPPPAGADDQPAGAVVVEVGLVQDPVFGPLITLTPAGDSDPRAGHPQARTLPLTDVDAADAVAAVFADAPAALSGRLQDLLLRVAALAEDLPEIADARLAPVTVDAGGAVVPEARVRVAAWEPHPELALRRLR
jgi:acyl-CoA synthetase (NDP forming)/RimJ/RimL family protein N-acetyltransferase